MLKKQKKTQNHQKIPNFAKNSGKSSTIPQNYPENYPKFVKMKKLFPNFLQNFSKSSRNSQKIQNFQKIHGLAGYICEPCFWHPLWSSRLDCGHVIARHSFDDNTVFLRVDIFLRVVFMSREMQILTLGQVFGH